ncbi:MAG: hypothetical protein A2161_03240 [Candidatus Schekmanbacteria bacterium RBG_13_48_7]|uniref:Uncharacterized protein n=1 Tax=Candidatus Schekmanbacteria bacterium RBG_13_48_7 TaxID=1817878 RepID=A0A1F7RU13_9BACT|nr:MAG: hypothetical protein A2161_03240 [Candidatus Schekmanbacteria bacterium RBG_13_48_7]
METTNKGGDTMKTTRTKDGGKDVHYENHGPFGLFCPKTDHYKKNGELTKTTYNYKDGTNKSVDRKK